MGTARRTLPGWRTARPLETTTFTGALRLTGMAAPFVHDGAMNGNVFRAYVDQVLVTTLAWDDVVIMDNLPAHKAAGVRDAIEAVGATLMFLPPYSPDFNPIETPLPSSSHYSAQRPSGQSAASGTPSAPSSSSSNPLNAQTTSRQLDRTGLTRTCSKALQRAHQCAVHNVNRANL
jgi:hypothetical protein